MKYLCDPHILPTNTCPPDIRELEQRSTSFAAFSPRIQLDIADGVFAPVVSWPFLPGQMKELEALPRIPLSDSILYEAHLMVQEPRAIGRLLAKKGAQRLVPHVESFESPAEAREAFNEWRKNGAQEVGLSILMDTPLERLYPYIELCDVVQLMSIAQIGAQGQPFDDRALGRVEELHARYPELMVAVDGGVSEANIEDLVRAGANRLCVGSAISRSSQPEAAYARIHERAMKGCEPIRASELVRNS